MGKRKTLFLLSGIVFLLFLGALYLWLAYNVSGSGSPEQYLPSKIAGFKLERELTGAEAFELVKTSHLGQLRAPSEAAIGYYQEGLTIWVSKYDSDEIALNEIERMVQAIGRFGRGFQFPVKRNIGNLGVYRTVHRGSAHYFWARKGYIFYIAPGPLSDRNAGQLIEDINNQL